MDQPTATQLCKTEIREYSVTSTHDTMQASHLRECSLRYQGAEREHTTLNVQWRLQQRQNETKRIEGNTNLNTSKKKFVLHAFRIHTSEAQPVSTSPQRKYKKNSVSEKSKEERKKADSNCSHVLEMTGSINKYTNPTQAIKMALGGITAVIIVSPKTQPTIA